MIQYDPLPVLEKIQSIQLSITPTDCESGTPGFHIMGGMCCNEKLREGGKVVTWLCAIASSELRLALTY